MEDVQLDNDEGQEVNMKNTSLNNEKISFEAWFSSRENQIPPHHRKEIIKADFKARKVPTLATLNEFDAALNQYGIKL